MLLIVAEADQIIEYLKQKIALIKEKAILQTTLREETSS